MAAQQSIGLLHKKLGAKLAGFHEKAKTQEIKPVAGGGDLPAGMNGIAECKELKFIPIKKEGPLKGQLMFYASGVVVEPEQFVDKLGNKYFTRGMRTSVTRPLYDTPNRAEGGRTVQDHWNWIVQLLGRLGVPVHQISFENVEEVCARMSKAGIHFRFRTWKGDKQTTGPYKDKEPLLNQVWEGAIDFTPPDVATQMTVDESTPPDEPTDAVHDDTSTEVVDDSVPDGELLPDVITEPPVEEAPKSTRFGNMAKPKTANKTEPAKNGATKPASGGKTAPKPAPKVKEPEPEPEPDVEPTLEEMAENAEGNDEYASKLTEAANAVGISDDEIAATEGGWAGVVEEIRRRESGEDTSEVVEEVTEEPSGPKMGDVMLFKPPKSTKAVQGQITKVDNTAQKANIKNLTDNKIYNVSFSALTPVPE